MFHFEFPGETPFINEALARHDPKGAHGLNAGHVRGSAALKRLASAVGQAAGNDPHRLTAALATAEREQVALEAAAEAGHAILLYAHEALRADQGPHVRPPFAPDPGADRGEAL